MPLSDQITSDMKEAMKAKNNATLSTLRLLRSALKNKQIELQHELSDEEVLSVIKSQVKQLKDAAVSFEEGGRDDLAKSTQVELVVLEAYMPEEMSEEQLTQIVKEVVEQTGATSKADFGKVMGAAMGKVNGQADGSRVKAIVEQLLASIVLFVVLMPSQVQAAIEVAAPVQTAFDTAAGLKLFRVLILWLGILSIITMIQGGAQYATASSRDDTRMSGLSKISTGFFGTLGVMIVFTAITVILERMS